MSATLLVAHAQERPRLSQFSAWARVLAEALERSLKGGVPPRKALEEAQRKAEAMR